MKKIFALIVLCTLIMGCSIQSRESQVMDYLNNHSEGFKDGIVCAELAVKKGLPISYCYEVLDILNKKLKDALL